MKKIHIDELRAGRHRPRLHGNGFIQLDITDRTRLQIWPFPEIGKQQVSTQIHNHVFGFTSEILLGRTLNVDYEVLDTMWSRLPATHEAYEAVPRAGSDTELQPIGRHVSVRVKNVQLLSAGDIYSFPPFAFHEHLPTRELVATVMTKTLSVCTARIGGAFYDLTEPSLNQILRPQVLVPEGVRPDNEFDRHDVNENDLWDIINYVCVTHEA